PECGGHNYENSVCTECDDFLRDEAPETDSLQYRKTKDENGEIVYMVMGVTERVPYIKIPTTHEGIPVAQIFFKAFYNDLNIKHVVLPESITFIDDRAFECCFSLLSINIPDSVTFIGKSAFSNCKIKNVSLASLTSVENFTFLGCGGLTNVVIPRGITTIGIAAFAGCSSLVELVIPDSVTEIGPEAFGDCSKLTSVTIPISIDWFGPGLFRRNYDLQDIFYEGTIEQWHAIQRAVGIFDTGEDAAWDALTGDYTVHCSDGDIPKAQATNP
ncbi:MAG: leucine-rich repeat domain-containing protein, partial [Clostridiales bacterium]|nr:leucine-rich repeat domain-containing protein [Clostridiales bacterium]